MLQLMYIDNKDQYNFHIIYYKEYNICNTLTNISCTKPDNIKFFIHKN